MEFLYDHDGPEVCARKAMDNLVECFQQDEKSLVAWAMDDTTGAPSRIRGFVLIAVAALNYATMEDT
jgi:hypothetical protein